MKILNEKQAETIYEVELTQGEVDVLFAVIAKTSEYERTAIFEKYGVSVPSANKTDNACEVYDLLKKISGFSK